MAGAAASSGGGGFGGITDLVTAIKNGVIALGSLNKTMSGVFPQATGTAATATAGAATLPANPVGFVQVFVPSLNATVKIPYYNT
jgi:hypothetical protein